MRTEIIHRAPMPGESYTLYFAPGANGSTVKRCSGRIFIHPDARDVSIDGVVYNPSKPEDAT